MELAINVHIGRELYNVVKTMYPGDRIYFNAGKKIAVIKHAVAAGPHEFDFHIHSRQTDKDKQPISIASTVNDIEDEFLERRVELRTFVPFTIGDHNNRGKLSTKLSYDSAPQIFTSKIKTDAVAWEVHYKQHYYSGRIDGGGAHANLNVLVPNQSMHLYKEHKSGFGTRDMIFNNKSWYDTIFD